MNELWADIITWVPWSVLWFVWGIMTFIELHIMIKVELQARTSAPKLKKNSWAKDPYENMTDSLVIISAVVLIFGGMLNWVYIIFLPIMALITSVCLLFVYFVCKLIVKYAPESDQAKGIVEFKQKHLTRKKKIVPEVVDNK